MTVTEKAKDLRKVGYDLIRHRDECWQLDSHYLSDAKVSELWADAFAYER